LHRIVRTQTLCATEPVPWRLSTAARPHVCCTGRGRLARRGHKLRAPAAQERADEWFKAGAPWWQLYAVAVLAHFLVTRVFLELYFICRALAMFTPYLLPVVVRIAGFRTSAAQLEVRRPACQGGALSGRLRVPVV